MQNPGLKSFASQPEDVAPGNWSDFDPDDYKEPSFYKSQQGQEFGNTDLSFYKDRNLPYISPNSEDVGGDVL